MKKLLVLFVVLLSIAGSAVARKPSDKEIDDAWNEYTRLVPVNFMATNEEAKVWVDGMWAYMEEHLGKEWWKKDKEV